MTDMTDKIIAEIDVGRKPFHVVVYFYSRENDISEFFQNLKTEGRYSKEIFKVYKPWTRKCFKLEIILRRGQWGDEKVLSNVINVAKEILKANGFSGVSNFFYTKLIV